jgi:hypothetical protein
MAKKVITEETLKKWLDVFFPFGYGGSSNNEDYQQQWYIGWLKVGGANELDYPCEINLDAGGTAIVFKWWNNGDAEYSDEKVAAYIMGVMALLDHDIVSTYRDGDGSLMLMEYNDEEDSPRMYNEREQKVLDIAKDILVDDGQDDYDITDVVLDDSANCIRVTISGGVLASTIVSIGQKFGDDDPIVSGNGNDTTTITFLNEKHPELIDK